MKKLYKAPYTNVVELKTKCVIMGGSEFNMVVNNNEGDTEAASYSRSGGSFWDDEEE